jgi:hypothetical protein
METSGHYLPKATFINSLLFLIWSTYSLLLWSPQKPSWNQVASYLLSRSILAPRILRPWRSRRYVPLKRRLTFIGLHGVISQKVVLFITTAVRTATQFKERKNDDRGKHTTGASEETMMRLYRFKEFSAKQKSGYKREQCDWRAKGNKTLYCWMKIERNGRTSYLKCRINSGFIVLRFLFKDKYLHFSSFVEWHCFQ